MPFKAKEVLQRLQRAGFEIRRQSGSHVVLRHADGRRLMWPCTPRMSRRAPSARFWNSQALRRKSSGLS